MTVPEGTGGQGEPEGLERMAPPAAAEDSTGAPAGSGPAAVTGPVDRLRFRYTKLGKIRFTSQRDVARMWERAFRRIGLPVAWSEGFSPRPLLSFGLALPTGAESLGEYLDVRLEAPADQWAGPELSSGLSGLLPDGITVQAAAPLPDDGGSLQQEVSSCSWDLEVLGLAADELATRVEQLLGAPSVVVRRVRKGRSVEDDLRPAVRTLALASAEPGSGEGPWHLLAELATQPRGVRPGELLEGLDAGLVLARACRKHQWIERDGARWEPLGIDGTGPGASAPHAEVRAS